MGALHLLGAKTYRSLLSGGGIRPSAQQVTHRAARGAERGQVPLERQVRAHIDCKLGTPGLKVALKNANHSG